MQGFHHVILTIDIHITELAIRSEIVNTSHMIEMDMADYNGINLRERKASGLLTEIWTAVY